jgi:hypothetical protein
LLWSLIETSKWWIAVPKEPTLWADTLAEFVGWWGFRNDLRFDAVDQGADALPNGVRPGHVEDLEGAGVAVDVEELRVLEPGTAQVAVHLHDVFGRRVAEAPHDIAGHALYFQKYAFAGEDAVETST